MKLMVKDGNYVHVADAHIESFTKKGYTVTDGVAPQPKDEVPALKEQCDHLSQQLAEAHANIQSMTGDHEVVCNENKRLTEENAALKAEIEKLKKAATKESKSK